MKFDWFTRHPIRHPTSQYNQAPEKTEEFLGENCLSPGKSRSRLVKFVFLHFSQLLSWHKDGLKYKFMDRATAV